MTTKKIEQVTRKQPSNDIEIVNIDSIEKLKKDLAKKESQKRK